MMCLGLHILVFQEIGLNMRISFFFFNSEHLIDFHTATNLVT